MIYTMLKSCFNKTESKLINQRDFKHFSQEAFKEDLSEVFCDCGNSYDDFDHISTTKLNIHAPKNKKRMRGNNKSHVTKALAQAIMKRSRLKNKANEKKDQKTLTLEIIKTNVTQRGKASILNMNVNMDLMTIKHFGKTVNPTLQTSIVKLMLILCLVKMKK